MDQELKDYLDLKFAETSRHFAEINGKLTEHDRLLAELREGQHQNGILLERLDENIRTVAEGVETNREVMYRLHEENRRELREFRVIFEPAHIELEHRVSGHDDEIEDIGGRVKTLEAVAA
jgi:hypothetical protein